MTVGELLAVTDNDQRFNLFSGRFGESTYTWYGLLTKKEIVSTEKKVVINNCYGGFGLTEKVLKEYAKLKGFTFYSYISIYSTDQYGNIIGEYMQKVNEVDKTIDLVHRYFKDYGEKIYREDEDYNGMNNNYFDSNSIARDDELLIKAIETIGLEESSGRFSELRIIEIPKDIDYEIEEYDGAEWVAEVHRTWH